MVVASANELGGTSGAIGTRLPVAYWLLVAAVVITAHGITLGNDFVSWDDKLTITVNYRVSPPTAGALLACWREPEHLWVPITYTVWWTVSAVIGLLGGSPTTLPAWPFHLLNLVVHAAASLTVMSLLNRIVRDGRAALVGALVFAAHPLQVETVAWASGLKDLLCGLFMFMALRAYIAAGDRAGRSRWQWWVFSTVLAAAAMLSKPTALVAPVLALAADRALLGRSWRQAICWAGPWMFLSLPIIWIGRIAQPPVFRPELMGITPADRLIVAGDTIAFYLHKLVFPWQMGIDYGHRPDLVVATQLSSGEWAASLLIIGAGAAVLWLLSRACGWPKAALAGVLFLAPLGPVMGFVQFDFQQYSTVADHYLYMPMAGVALVVAVVVAKSRKLADGGRSVRLVGAVAITGMIVASAAQGRTWRNSQSLFNQALRANPSSWAADNSLAAYLIDQGDYARARDLSERAARIAPFAAGPQITLGVARGRMNDEAGALEAFWQAVALEPANPVARVNLGGLLAKQRHIPEAADQLTQAVRLDPHSAEARLNLGALLDLAGRTEEAARELRTAVDLAPGNSQAHANLGIVLSEMNRRAEALSELRESLRLDPNNAEARRELELLGAVP